MGLESSARVATLALILTPLYKYPLLAALSDAEPKIRELVEQLMQRESTYPQVQANPVELNQAQSKSELVQQCIDACVKATSKSPEACFDGCTD